MAQADSTQPATGERTTKPEVFELGDTVQSWDDDYYQPAAIKLYDMGVARMLKLMEVPQDATVLDGGCGPGVHSIRVARAGCKVHAIDLSETMLAEAKKRVADAGFADSVSFEQQDLTALTLPDESFDYVFSWGVVIHIRNAEPALENLARIVKPGGKLALYFTSRSGLDHKLERLARKLTGKPHTQEELDLGQGVWYDMHDEKLWVWRFDHAAVARFLKPHGFTLKHRVIGELTEVQRRIGGPARTALLHLNNLAYKLRCPASLGVTNLLVFEKQK